MGDDLASLALDAAAEEEGYRCTGFNPFALPG
ncbi:formate dehydrogenase accessory protein FdhE [Rhizobium sp. S95]|nr:formate dehydrogenase accessory protein FdhE [Ciceribacter sp. S95]